MLQDLLTRAGQPGPPLGQPVQARFAALAVAVAGENGAPAPLDRALQAANDVYLALPPGGVAPTPAQASQVKVQADKLAAAAAGLPPPVKEPLVGLADRLEGLAGGQVLSRINDEYRAKVMPFCRQALAGRFPFDLGAARPTSAWATWRACSRPAGCSTSSPSSSWHPSSTWRSGPGSGCSRSAAAAARWHRSSWRGGCATACSRAVPWRGRVSRWSRRGWTPARARSCSTWTASR